MTFRDGRFSNGNAASRAASRVRARELRLFASTSLRQRKVRLTTLQVQGRIGRLCGRFLDWLARSFRSVAACEWRQRGASRRESLGLFLTQRTSLTMSALSNLFLSALRRLLRRVVFVVLLPSASTTTA